MTKTAPPGFRSRLWTALAVSGLLLLHYGLAAHSLLQENPTIDEVVHLPAGVTYWQKHTFRLYHHNPPLVKLVAALPVICSGASTKSLYESKSWTSREPEQAPLAHLFAVDNATRYFELFALARLVMPLFSVIGGLAVFAWSRRLYGTFGGLLSLALWVFCPNVLAHSRLITSDLGATAIGVLATFLFWSYVKKPSWLWRTRCGRLAGRGTTHEVQHVAALRSLAVSLVDAPLDREHEGIQLVCNSLPRTCSGPGDRRDLLSRDRRRLSVRRRGNPARPVRVRVTHPDDARQARLIAST